MIKGPAGEWYEDGYVGGYFNNNGDLVVWEEYGLSDRDIGRHSVEIQNGDGFYDSNGKYVPYGR